MVEGHGAGQPWILQILLMENVKTFTALQKQNKNATSLTSDTRADQEMERLGK